MVKVVVCDIDNTLVVKHHTLTPRAKKAIQILQKHNVLFGIASGRPLDELKLIDGWGIKCDLIIGMNGCKLVDIDGTIHSYFPMKKEWIEKAIDIMKPFDCNPLVSYGGLTLIKHYDEFCEMSKKYSGKDHRIIKDISELYEHDNDKIMFRVHEEDMEAIERHIALNPQEEFKGFKTGSMMVEFANKNANKGYALEQFCKLHNIDIKDTYAFGDTTNDNEMLEVAGVGVCMKNGTEDTKISANVITDKECDEDGWADFVENHILKVNGWL